MQFEVAVVETPTQSFVKAKAECRDDVLVVMDRQNREVARFTGTRELRTNERYGDDLQAFTYQTEFGEVVAYNTTLCACGGLRIEQKAGT